ncbi:C40 family peptidase [Paenibacillus sp. IHBB 10380]|uniref:C40 family peptidase n=1 Tax=Paenibacillus sp. IHBB 10380 TaxID=1566358 RepID=UPI0005CFBA30|nr:C40 family peptidase [Paenibacillus sp. IHBB 10380]AJS61700.1 hydrolase [Paenibacillus sp. IHBB 10380]
MNKKLVSSFMGLALLFTIGTGSAFADSKMDTAIAPTLGTSYKNGGVSTSGFDCSGFTMYIFEKLGINLPHQSGSQFGMGTAVDRSDLREGDLVFFNTSGKGVSHVGIYVGDGKFAHASSSNGVIINSLSESYYVSRYIGAKRIMSTDTYEAVAID